MAKHRVVVVGNGLFGSIAATLARKHGHDVTVISDKQPHAASLASGCVLAPSWLASLDKQQIDNAYGVLSELYQVIPVEFRTNLLKTFKASRVDPRLVLIQPDVVDKVVNVGRKGVTTASGKVYPGKVLVAAGIWTRELLPEVPPMKGLWGAALKIKGTLDAPRIHVYAPYKQAVAFQLSKSEAWMGDGTSLIESTWKKTQDQRVAATLERAEMLFKLSGKTQVTVGVRPMVEGHKAGFFHKVADNVWVSTGGAKNGTVLAAEHAHRFLKEALK